MTTIPTSSAAQNAANATAATNSSSSSTSSGASALAQFSNNFQSFLTLLTTQLQNQDPLNPMDSTQFTSQLVQFTGVEQGILQNQNLQQLIALQTNTQLANDVGYLGTQVNDSGNKVQLSGSTGTINYDVTDPTTAQVVVTITDSNGNTINSFTNSSPSVGQQTVQWNGTNTAGTVVPDGTYNVKVQGFNAQGNPVSVTTGTQGTVSNVSLVNGQVVLTLQNGQQVPVSDVTQVTNPNSNSLSNSASSLANSASSIANDFSSLLGNSSNTGSGG